jgi:hypothetical protein
MRYTLILVAAVSLAIAEESGGLKVWGNFQNDLIATQTFDGDFKDQFNFTGNGILTLNARNKDNSSIKVEGSADIIMLYGAGANLIPQGQRSLLLSSTEGSVLFDLRKLYAGFFGDALVGRQIINFGQGLVFSPIDVFSSVNVFELAFKRSGSDVARLRVPFSPTMGAEATVGLATAGKTLAALKVYGNYCGVDVAAIGIYRGAADEAIAGLTFKGDLVAGVYGEVAGHVNTENRHRYVDAMLGADYSINAIWFFNVEYLYDASPDSSDISPLAQVGLGGGGISGGHSGYASVRYVFNEITSVGIAGVVDPEKRLGFATGQFSRDILQNATMIAYVRYLYSKKKAGSLTISDMLYGLRLNAAF